MGSVLSGEDQTFRIMLDLETFGVSGEAAIVQIGACTFTMRDGELGQVFKRNVSLQSSILYGLVTDDSTIQFWRDQMRDNPAAVELLLDRPAENLLKVMRDLSEWWTAEAERFAQRRGVVGPAQELWTRGCDFDVAILKRAFLLTGVKPPFRYDVGRDVRTIVATARDLGFPYDKTDYKPRIEHDSEEDCYAQIRLVSAAHNFLREDAHRPPSERGTAPGSGS